MAFFKELSIELTKQCVLKCIYCSSDATIEKNERLDIIKLKNVIESVKKIHRINKISLSGGDPLIYPDFLDVFNLLKSMKFKILIYSSGIVLDQNGKISPVSSDLLQQIKISPKNPEIHLNLQGYDKKTIENINGVPDSYEILQQTIANIKRERLFLGANVVPFKNNYQNLEKIYDFCISNGFDQINFLRFVPQGRGKGGEFNLNPREFFEVQKSLVKILERSKNENNKIVVRIGHPINFLFLLGKKDLYPQEKSHCCRGGIDAPLILPDGTVAMCPAWKELQHFSPGNIYNSHFSFIWSSREFKLFRDFVKNGYKELNNPCKECEYLNECKGKCVAQRLLSSSNETNETTFKELYCFAPDPLCFKHLVEKDKE